MLKNCLQCFFSYKFQQFNIEFLSPSPWYFLSYYQGGVQRVHLLDGTIGGVLLLELFKRDGMGTMVARYATFSNVFQKIFYGKLYF